METYHLIFNYVLRIQNIFVYLKIIGYIIVNVSQVWDKGRVTEIEPIFRYQLKLWKYSQTWFGELLFTHY